MLQFITSQGVVSEIILALAAVGVALLLIAAWVDVATRHIPNALVMLLLPLGVLRHVIESDLLAAFGGALLVFAVAVFCWMRGWLGGGDAKLFGVAALLVPQQQMVGQVMVTVVFGGVLALLVMGLRPIAANQISVPCRTKSAIFTRVWRVEAWRLRHGGSLPYAVAIALGTTVAIIMGGR